MSTTCPQAPPGRLVELAGGRTHLQESGPPDGPVVLAVHGLASYSFVWNQMTPSLTEAGYRVVALDLYGRGWSDRLSVDYGLELFLEQMDGIVDLVAAGRRIHLLGWSMGGLLVLNWAARHPGSTASVTAISPAGLHSPRPWIFRLIKRRGISDALMWWMGDRLLLASLNKLFASSEPLGAFREQFREQLRRPGVPQAVLSSFRHMPIDDAEAAYAQVGQHGVPSQFLWGDRDQVCSVQTLARLLELVPEAEARQWPNAGHGVHIECQDEVNPCVVDFLRRHPAG